MDKDLAALLLSGFIKQAKYIFEFFMRIQHARSRRAKHGPLSDQRLLSINYTCDGALRCSESIVATCGRLWHLRVVRVGRTK